MATPAPARPDLCFELGSRAPLTWDGGARPLLVGDAYVVPRGTATILDAGRGVRVLPRHWYDLYERLAPALDGASDLDSLTAPLPPPQARAVLALVGELAAAGLVRDARTADASGLSPRLRRRWSEVIAFLEAWVDRPEDVFARYRSGTVRLAGAGPLVGAVQAAVVATGVRTAGVQRLRAGAACSKEATVGGPIAGPTVVVSTGADPGLRALALTLTGHLAFVRVLVQGRDAAAVGTAHQPQLLHGPAGQVLGARVAFVWLCLQAGLLADTDEQAGEPVEPVLSVDLRDLSVLRQLSLHDLRSPLPADGHDAVPGRTAVPR